MSNVKINIHEVDNTKGAGLANAPSDVALVFGFTSRTDDKVAEILDLPILCTTLNDFKSTFGSAPYTLTSQDVGSYKTSHKITEGPDKSYIYATELLSAGLPVVYVALSKPAGSTSILDAIYGSNDKLSEILELLKDKNEYSVKYVTTGGYPSVCTVLEDQFEDILQIYPDFSQEYSSICALKTYVFKDKISFNIGINTVEIPDNVDLHLLDDRKVSKISVRSTAMGYSFTDGNSNVAVTVYEDGEWLDDIYKTLVTSENSLLDAFGYYTDADECQKFLVINNEEFDQDVTLHDLMISSNYEFKKDIYNVFMSWLSAGSDKIYINKAFSVNRTRETFEGIELTTDLDATVIQISYLKDGNAQIVYENNAWTSDFYRIVTFVDKTLVAETKEQFGVFTALDKSKPYPGEQVIDGVFDFKIANNLITFAATRGDCVALVDSINDKDLDHETFRTSMQGISETNAEFGTAMYPWGIYSTSTQDTELPASFGYLMSLAKSIKTSPNWLAIAGVTRGVVPNLKSLNVKAPLTNKIAENMQPKNGVEGNNRAINCITNIRPYGYTLWGNRTLRKVEATGCTATNFLNTRNSISDIKKVLYSTATSLMFEQNTETLWLRFKAGITPLLDQYVAGGALSDFKIIKSDTTRDGSPVQKGEIAAIVRIFPMYAVEFFDLTVDIRDSDVVVE